MPDTVHGHPWYCVRVRLNGRDGWAGCTRDLPKAERAVGKANAIRHSHGVKISAKIVEKKAFPPSAPVGPLVYGGRSLEGAKRVDGSKKLKGIFTKLPKRRK